MQQWLSDEELDKVMLQYDTNKNGVIDFDEFCKLVRAASSALLPSWRLELSSGGWILFCAAHSLVSP